VLPAVQEIISGLGNKVPVIYYTKASHHLLPAVGARRSQRAERGLAHSPCRSSQNGPAARGPAGESRPRHFVCPREKIRQATLDIAAELSGHGHILNLGTGILQHTPVESAQLFIHTGQQAALHQAPAAVQMLR